MNKKLSNKYLTSAYVVGYLGIIVSTVLHILDTEWAFHPFCVSALLTIIGRGLSLPSGDFRIRRLNMILLVGAFGLIGTAYFMYKGSNSWAVSLLISAIIDLYTSFRYKDSSNS